MGVNSYVVILVGVRLRPAQKLESEKLDIIRDLYGNDYVYLGKELVNTELANDDYVDEFSLTYEKFLKIKEEVEMLIKEEFDLGDEVALHVFTHCT